MRGALLLLAITTAVPAQGQDLTRLQKREVFSAISEALQEYFYDEKLNGVVWSSVEERYLARFEQAEDAQGLRDLVREVLNLLDASHTLVSSPEERALTSNILPFAFERVEGRVFVSDVLAVKSGDVPAVSFGDEILAVGGTDPSAMRPYSLRTNRSPVGNPYFGTAGSSVRVRVRRGERELTVDLRRARRWSDFKTQTLQSLPGDIAVLRLLTIGNPDSLRTLLAAAFEHRALILDLRNNGGGIDQASQPLLSALLGPGREVDIRIPRETEGPFPVADYDADPPEYAAINDLLKSGHRVRMLTHESAMLFDGPVAVLIGPNTQSQAEAVAAALKHNDRAKRYGRRTAGALNGSQFGIPLPYGLGGISVPWYNTAFGDGRAVYEGIGVPPDVEILNHASDFELGRDRVLEAAVADLR